MTRARPSHIDLNGKLKVNDDNYVHSANKPSKIENGNETKAAEVHVERWYFSIEFRFAEMKTFQIENVIWFSEYLENLPLLWPS